MCSWRRSISRTESGEHLEWNVIPEFEHLDAPFEIYPGVIVHHQGHINGTATGPKRTPPRNVAG